MLSKQFNEIAKYAMLRGGILAVMAVITFLYPLFLTGGMVYVIAGYVILNGILGALRSAENTGSEGKISCNLHLLVSIGSILFGILCIIYFRYAVGILPVFLGVLLIVESVVHFIAARCVKSKLTPMIILLSILTAVGGIVLMVFSFGFGEVETLSQIFGSLLVLSCLAEGLIYLSHQQIKKSTGGENQ